MTFDNFTDMTVNGQEIIKLTGKINDVEYLIWEKYKDVNHIVVTFLDGHKEYIYLTEVPEQGFLERNDIKSVELCNHVKSIGKLAFYNCSSLTSITIPDSVKSIGNDAFVACTSLQEIKIPSSVTTIEDSLFVYCISLTSITIPNSVTSIGNFAFADCNSLTSINYSGTINEWRVIEQGSLIFDGVPSTCIVHCSDGDINI